jgi:hypothetical protein
MLMRGARPLGTGADRVDEASPAYAVILLHDITKIIEQ